MNRKADGVTKILFVSPQSRAFLSERGEPEEIQLNRVKAALGNRRLDFDFRMTETDEIPDATNYDGVVIAGSRHFVTDQSLPWLKPLGNNIKTAIEYGTPVFGICFGHQLIAQEFGSEVVDLPSTNGEKTELIGILPSYLTDEARKDPLFAAIPVLKKRNYISSGTFHFQTTRTLPKKLQVLAKGQSDAEYQSFGYGNCRTVQFHPELPTELLKFVLNKQPGRVKGNPTTLRDIQDANFRIIQNFFDNIVAPYALKCRMH